MLPSGSFCLSVIHLYSILGWLEATRHVAKLWTCFPEASPGSAPNELPTCNRLLWASVSSFITRGMNLDYSYRFLAVLFRAPRVLSLSELRGGGRCIHRYTESILHYLPNSCSN